MFDLPRIPAVTMVSVQAATSVLLMLTRETLCQLTKQTLTSLLNVSTDFTWCLNFFPSLPFLSFTWLQTALLLYHLFFNISCWVSNFGTGRPSHAGRWKRTQCFWSVNQELRHSFLLLLWRSSTVISHQHRALMKTEQCEKVFGKAVCPLRGKTVRAHCKRA